MARGALLVVHRLKHTIALIDLIVFLRDLVAEDGTVNVFLVEKVCEHLAYEYNYEKKEGFRDVCADFYSTGSSSFS